MFGICKKCRFKLAGRLRKWCGNTKVKGDCFGGQKSYQTECGKSNYKNCSGFQEAK